MTRHRLAPPSVLAALVLIAGCADSQRTAGPEPSPDDFTDPAEFLQAHADALHDRDLDRYAALLASDFEFEPTSDDLLDLPWITPASPWSRALELIAIGNMMNPEFTSSVTGEHVQSIDMTLLSVTAIAADPLRVRGEAEIRVVWSPDAYAFAHTLLTFELVPDADGFLRIRRIVESGTARATPGLEVLTWADIKARFYEGDLP